MEFQGNLNERGLIAPSIAENPIKKGQKLTKILHFFQKVIFRPMWLLCGRSLRVFGGFAYCFLLIRS